MLCVRVASVAGVCGSRALHCSTTNLAVVKKTTSAAGGEHLSLHSKVPHFIPGIMCNNLFEIYV